MRRISCLLLYPGTRLTFSFTQSRAPWCFSWEEEDSPRSWRCGKEREDGKSDGESSEQMMSWWDHLIERQEPSQQFASCRQRATINAVLA